MSGIEIASGELMGDAKPERRQVPREAPCYDAKSKNIYGVDMSYFRKEFAKLSRDLDSYTPDELVRYLERLRDVAAL